MELAYLAYSRYSVIDDSRIILGDNEGRISLLLIEKKDKVATNAERSLMVSDLGEVRILSNCTDML